MTMYKNYSFNEWLKQWKHFGSMENFKRFVQGNEEAIQFYKEQYATWKTENENSF